jgi:hypothetical protein
MYDISVTSYQLQAQPTLDPILQRFKSKKVEKEFRELMKGISDERLCHTAQRVCPSIRNRESAFFDIISNELVPGKAEAHDSKNARYLLSRSICGRRILEPHVQARQRRQRRSDQQVMNHKSHRARNAVGTPEGRIDYDIINNEQLPVLNKQGGTTAWEKLNQESKACCVVGRIVCRSNSLS